ncbi:MAG: hypothetical protein ABW098_04940 [Candidatus Thiodiazotropha sp.]
MYPCEQNDKVIQRPDIEPTLRIMRQHPTVGTQVKGAHNADESQLVRVEIDSSTLLQLLKGRRICASDMHCLDCESKRCLMRLLLRACAQDMVDADPMDHRLITS